MEETECTQAKSAAFQVLLAPSLQGKVFLEGGLVPWVISGRDSPRKHDDADFAVREEDMYVVRNWLKVRAYTAMTSILLTYNAIPKKSTLECIRSLMICG